MCQGPCVRQTALPMLALCPQPRRRCIRLWATRPAGTPENSWTLELRPLRPSLRAAPLPSSPRWLGLPESQAAAAVPGADGGEGGSEGGSWLPARRRSLQPAALPPAAGAPGHAGALGPRGSMKGGDRAYPRGPSLRWLVAKCCCCFPCKGEWLSAFAPPFSQSLGRLPAGEGGRAGGGQWGAAEGGCSGRVYCSFPGRRRADALALSRGGSAWVAELQFGNCYLSATLAVRAPACRAVGCGGGGPGEAPGVVCESPQWRVALPCSHLHMDLSFGIH